MLGNNQDKSSHGGPRKGSGRKPGAATTKTREIADKAAAEGVTPLEVLLMAMRHHMAEFDKTKNVDHLGPACSAAKDAAPYIHPRLASIEVDAAVTVRTLAEELTALNAH
jgi:hypothetical protein